ncbi:MAG: gliding motility-associated C-terminal domain-containing protein [Flavobacteriales bacterium]|jgi:gliding motility-associated-like protein|nr:gliding motility-associated C-terminal domain-containing protein [Flavobacteriales bacterium]
MKNIYWAFLLLITLLPQIISAQLVDYEIRLVEIMATADNTDGLGLDQDPTWYLWFKDNGTNGSAITAWVPTGCIHLEDNTYGSWFNGTPNDGPALPYSWQVVTGTDASQIQTEMEGYEKDCPDNCDYEDECYCIFGLCAEDDDNHDTRANSGNIDFQLDPPCQWNQYSISNDDYYARIEIYWTFTALDPGEIDGEQYVCLGGDPTELGSVLGGDAALSSWVTYQWQESVGCTGAFVDVLGATNATYDPPLGILQNTCYRRKVVSACGEAISNEQVVGIEVPSVAATSVTAAPTLLCGPGDVTLSVNGGSLGSNADWYWYDDDPNSNGNLLGTGDPFTINISTTSTFYVRAEGNCSVTNSVSKEVVVELPSNAPTALTPSNATICQGETVNLSATGGVLGTNALYAWYDVDPLIGNPLPIHTSSIPTYTGLTPATTTTYYVRIEGCNITNHAFTTVTVNEPSTDPTGVNSNNTTVCPNDVVTLTVNGGSLGTGADWYWYESGCGAGTSIGSGATINVTPTVTTNYFVRAEGTCGMSNCANITIVVDEESTPPVSIVATASTICPGDATILSVVGGSLGTGADWNWYSGACGGLLVGTGTTISVNPGVTTDYFVRAEGACNTTPCVATTITTKTSSTDATGITVSANNICSGTPITLAINGGTLGTGATWEWYTSSCGGIYLGSGNTMTVSPTATTTYYVRAEGDCNMSGCVNTTVIVQPSSVLPTSITVTNPTVCPGGSTDLTVVGGQLVPGDNWTWYEGGCGAGTSIGTGNTINVSPTGITEYYVRGEGTCGATNCASVTVNTSTVSIEPTSIVATNTALCAGQSTVLSVSGGMLGTNATWNWYSGSCGLGPVGTGNSISVSPSATTTYFVRGEGTCGNSICTAITITVGAGVPDPVSANLTFDNLCPGETTTLSVTGNPLPPDYTWVWYTGACGAVPVGVGEQIDVEPTSTETYYVRAVGTCGATVCESVTVNVQNGSIPPTGITVSNNDFCAGEPTTLTVQGGNLVAGADWVWYENSCGGTPVATGSPVTLSPTNSVTYYVRSEGGVCGNTPCTSAFVSVIETIVHCNPFDTICGIGNSFALQGGEPDGGFYSGNGVDDGVFYPELAGEGTHTITYTYTSPLNGCTQSVDKELVITPSELTARIKVEELPCSQGGVTLSVTSQNTQGFLDYLWSNGSYEPEINFVEEGEYSVVIEDSEGCLAKSDEVAVTSEMECIEIPNTFTPNADGKNDTWNLYFDGYAEAELTVLSKWGRVVFTSNELEVHWDGKSNGGAELPAGVYYYVLKLNRGDKKQNGVVTLLR